MIAEFSIVPMVDGESISPHVARILRLVKDSGLDHQLTAMGTIVEGEPEPVFNLILNCHLEMKQVANRVLTRISIDDRGDELNRMARKTKSVLEKLDD